MYKIWNQYHLVQVDAYHEIDTSQNLPLMVCYKVVLIPNSEPFGFWCIIAWSTIYTACTGF